MANQQVYQAYPQNKGTLIPGQTISVNNYTVQVERYLSQGGFAHVYLVRTPTPVYNTTHHVLKRIAVANESMLTEVKKEVDIMRLLKGHPNIVHLIDAAWHKLPNGTFEVFILMEYCPGGGIIDMMNRRLRERLTEAEILQIFVDVSEGVAYMHNSRPPLLHRDLKVENILQSSPTSFKLCDFGSATTVSNPPTNMQEIRALEADLNRHTTLQYRAPEMVDVYSKRPVNEKSDVWALGVLLYKLCYYTTPFEEHGPLAILNVQYRIPPYPVYSQDMNMLIASMLREHGAQRPTVFELLNHVHRLRGTKSKFSYSVPAPPSLLPRTQAHAKPLPSPNPLDGIVSYGIPPTKSAISIYDPKSLPNPPALNQGIQARDKVLEAIAPMRRGRPTTSQNSSSRPSSPQKNTQSRQTNQEKPTEWSDNGFGTEQDKAWKAATAKSSVVGDYSADAWGVGDGGKKPRTEKKERPPGFGDDFAEKLWNSSDPNSAVPLPPRLSPRPNINMNAMKTTDNSLAFTGTSRIRPKQDRLLQNRDKDAFEGLGLMTSTPKSPPTLGEARKLRTGLAVMSTSVAQDNNYRDTGKSNATSGRPSPSPQTMYLSTTPFQSQSISPVPTPGTSNSTFYRPSPSPSGAGPSSSTTTDGLPIESRFPSLEELDAQFNPALKPSANAFYPSSVNDASGYAPQMTNQAGNRSQYSSRTSYIGTSGTGGNLLQPSLSPNISHSVEGVRSEQVTGIAMREQKESRKPEDSSIGSSHSLLNRGHPTGNDISLVSLKDGNSIPKPLTVRKHRSSVTMKPAFTNGKATDTEDFRAAQSSSNGSLVPPKLSQRPSVSAASTPPRDWLTGEDYEDPKPHMPSDVPILRDSPSKRASFIETSNFMMPSSATAQHVLAPERLVDEPQSADLSPTVSKFKRSFPAVDKIDTQQSQPSFSSGLTDNWSPIATRNDIDVDSSSADEGPEEPRSATSVAQKRHASRAKGRQGRQSSVHELVHQYGGGVAIKEKEKERERPSGQYKDDSKPQKAKPSGLAPPPTTLDLDRKTPSPTTNMTNPMLTAPNRSPRLQPQVMSDKPQTPINPAKPPSSRSRPQSMFIFPSKSTDSSVASSTTTNLMPPQESKPRATRRTSISDMVQRYEAIGGSAKSPTGIPPGPPSPVHRPGSAKALAVSADNGRIQRGFPEPIKPITSKNSVSNDTSSYSGGDTLKPRTATHEPVRQATTGLSRTPTKVQRKFTSDKDRPASGSSPTPDKGIPRPRRISVKAEPPTMGSSHTRSETNSTKVSLSSESFRPPSSPRKPTISVGEDSSSKSEEPERPYQGVGRLIDQWQKKSAEAEQARPVPPGKRVDLIPKRAGIVRGEDR